MISDHPENADLLQQKLAGIEAKLQILNVIDAKLDVLKALISRGTSHQQIKGTHGEWTVELNVRNANIFAEIFGSTAPDSSKLEGRFASWRYEWFRDSITGQANTFYTGSFFVIRNDTGETLNWNLIESSSTQAVDLPYWSKGPYYQYARNAWQIGFGTGQTDSVAHHVSSCVNCYADWGSVSFIWHSDS